MARKLESSPEDYPQAPSPTLNEEHDGLLLDNPEVEIEISENMKQAELAAFMEEKVMVRLAPKKGASKMELVSPSVNGRIQHIFRGIPQVVARKYIEVLVRSHEVTYDYENEAGQAILEGDLPRAATTPTHPLDIVQDSAEGRAWFERLRQQAL